MIVNKGDLIKRIVDNRLFSFSAILSNEQYACIAPLDIYDDRWIDLTKSILISNQEKEIYNKVYAPINY